MGPDGPRRRRRGIPRVLRHRRFDVYWGGIVLSEIGARGTIVANYFHVHELTGSTAQTGLVGLAQAAALILLSPVAGAWADRLDRARLLQASQAVSLAVSGVLAGLTLTGAVRPWHILASVLVNTAAEAVERPCRTALIPALVPRTDLVQAFALVNPSRELAVLLGPAIAGLLTATSGIASVYLLDCATYVTLIIAVAVLRIRTPRSAGATTVRRDIAEGFRWITGRPLVLQLIALDLSAGLFATYRAVLPALSTDVLGVGPEGYGLLSAAPSAGALLGTAVLFPLLHHVRAGAVVLWATAAYGAAIAGLGLSTAFVAALLAAAAAGAADAMATSLRQAAVQLEVPDRLRGRVTSSYQIASRGGPAAGEVLVGSLAAVIGPGGALVAGAVAPIAAAAVAAATGSAVTRYRVPGSDDRVR
jgi:MFS family permease